MANKNTELTPDEVIKEIVDDITNDITSHTTQLKEFLLYGAINSTVEWEKCLIKIPEKRNWHKIEGFCDINPPKTTKGSNIYKAHRKAQITFRENRWEWTAQQQKKWNLIVRKLSVTDTTAVASRNAMHRSFKGDTMEAVLLNRTVGLAGPKKKLLSTNHTGFELLIKDEVITKCRHYK